MKKKEKILETAITLFNEKGYHKVSLREIAREAGTTIGNLTYHFPQKDDLLVSIVEELHTEFLISEPSEIHRAELLSYLLNSFLTAERNQIENIFYYKNIPMLSLESEAIAKKNNFFQKKLFKYYISILTTLREDGVLRQDIDDTDIQSLAYTIITLMAVWMQANVPYQNNELPTMRISVVLSRLLYPFLTEKYIEEFALLCKEKRIK